MSAGGEQPSLFNYSSPTRALEVKFPELYFLAR